MSLTIIPMGNLPYSWYGDVPDEWQGEVFRLDRELRLIRDNHRGQLLLVRRCDQDGFIYLHKRRVPGWFVQMAFPYQRQHLGHILDCIRRGDMWSWGPNREAALAERNRRIIEGSEAPSRAAMAEFEESMREMFTPRFDDALKGRVRSLPKGRDRAYIVVP